MATVPQPPAPAGHKVWKFPLFTDREYRVAVRMPVGAQIVHFAIEYRGPLDKGPRHGVPTIWALVDVAPGSAYEQRTFQVFGTGHDLPPHARHVGTYDAEPFVWHVFEIAADVPADLPAEAHDFYRLLIADGFKPGRPHNGHHAWLAPDGVEPGRLSREQIIAIAELQEHGYGPVVNA